MDGYPGYKGVIRDAVSNPPFTSNGTPRSHKAGKQQAQHFQAKKGTKPRGGGTTDLELISNNPPADIL